MNIERLHRILKDLDKEIESNNFHGLLSNLQNHLQNQVNNPQDTNHQKKLVQTLDSLNSKLEQSAYNDYSPSWKQVIEEIGGDRLFGHDLKERISEIFTRNQITAANALEEIKFIVSDFNTHKDSIKKALEAFQGLNIGDEELEEGECELGYTIPRSFIDNKLHGLENEIHELSFILNNLSEAVAGTKQEYKVKTISSSDFLLYVIIGLQVAEILAKATERILNIYKNILDIKLKRNELKEIGVPDSRTKGIETHANSLMEKEIIEIAKKILDENYQGKIERKNELENAVTFALNKLANRIDNGFNVEIRVKPLPEPEAADEEGKSKEEAEKERIIDSISTSAKNIEYIKTEGKAILKLPENKKE